jgi:transcriptional regulator with GAF, ATPase, and Fis domain/predicted Ser/Thr protein kinase
MGSGTWKILRPLGEGGMGSVFLAETPEGEPVALKLLFADPASLAREFAVLSRLRHPHIVSVRGFSPSTLTILGREEGPCLWMDYVEGRPLLEAARDTDHAVIFRHFEQGLEALAYLHGQGIAHGDLAPGNLLIDAGGRLRLLDFGLSASLRTDDEAPKAATIPYAAPERLLGKRTPTADLYALGVLFYEALAGAHPRAGARNLRDYVERPVRPLAEARPSLGKVQAIACRVIDRLLEADPARRFASAGDVLRALKGDEIRPAVQAPHAVLRTVGRAAGLLEEAIKRLDARAAGAWVAVHGTTGVGKDRFLRELTIEAALRGLQDRLRVFRDLHAAPDADLAHLEERAAERPGDLAVLHWNDDFLTEGRRDFLKSLLGAQEGLDAALADLDPAATRELLAAALGEAPAEQAATAFFEQTGGNPRLLLEMVSSYREAASRPPRPKLAAWLKGLPRLHSLEAILRERIAGLGPERKVLEAVAAAGVPLDRARLEALQPDSSRTLAALEERGLVTVRSGRIRLALPSLEEAVLGGMPHKELTALHERWMAALGQDPDDDLQKVHHALKTGREDLVLRGARAAAESLQKDGRHAEALALADDALKIVLDREETSRLMRLKMNLLNTLGRYEDALAAAEEWKDLDADDEPRSLRTVKYWLGTGLYLQAAGRGIEAAERFKRCLDAGDEGDAAHRPFLTRARALLGVFEMRRENLEEAAVHFERGLDLAAPSGRERAEILRHMAELAATQRRIGDAERLRSEAIRLYEEANYPDGVFSAHLQWGNFLLDQGDLVGAGAAYARAESVAHSEDRPLNLALVWANRSRLARLEGHLADALELIARAEDFFRLTGQSDDLEEAFKYHALTLAEAGRFADAEGFLTRIRSPERAREVREALDAPPALPPSRLRAIYESLPPELQVHFVERADWKRLQEGKNPEDEPMPTNTTTGRLLDDFAELNLTLLEEEDMDRVLGRLLDAGLRIGRAENGLLLLQSEAAEGPLPGFSVAAARNVDPNVLEREDYTASLSAVRRAMKTGQAVVTDNALQDPSFREAKSVQMRGLRSVLALPIPGDRGPAGVFYMDHRLEEGLFQGDHLAALKSFATVAALALQKGRMIERLKARNTELSHEIEVKDSEMGHLQREVIRSRQALKKEYGEIIGRSPKMLKVLSLVDRITDSKIPVWIFGESGTGKEAIARALHFNSPRAKAAFVSENCSALPESLLESELFGHKKGAFTHAAADKKGLLQHADKGTIFLDEIADMSLPLQAKLLRFLQEGEVRPIGSTQVLKVDARVVSASNKDLAQLVAEGKFREDLFFRLNGVTVALPPLRERREDIAPLCEHFLNKIAEREDKKKLHIAPETMKRFLNYDWPGNIRELQNTLETASLFAERSLITPDSLDFKPALRQAHAARPLPAARPSHVASKTSPPPATKTDAYRLSKEDVDPELERILRAIRDESFNRSNAAKALGMSRRNLYVKLEKFGVPRDDRALRDYVDRYVR